MPPFWEDGESGGNEGGGGGGSTSGGTEGGSGNPDEPIIDCSDPNMTKAKQIALNAHNKLLKAVGFNIKGNRYISIEMFKDTVRSNSNIEWYSFLRDYTNDGYNIGLTNPSTSNMESSASTNHLYNSDTEVAAIHNHGNSSPISAVDIMELIKIRTVDNCPNFSSMIVWDNIKDEYYYATINDVDKAKVFYDNYRQYVDYDTGYWQHAQKKKDKNKVDFF